MLLPLLVLLEQFVANSNAASICKNRNFKAHDDHLPGQNQDFKHLVTKNYIFVDKSLLIKNFVDNPAKVILVTCPRNWGKSMNLDMMQTFFQPELDDCYKKVPSKNAWNYKLFALGQLDDGKITQMNIAKHPNIIDRYLGQHPVIYLNLGWILASSTKTIVESLKWPLMDAFEYHMCIMYDTLNIYSNSTQKESDRNAAKALFAAFQKFESAGNFTEEEAVGSLKFLSKHLHERFGKKVFIFLDDYDEPFKDLFARDGPKNIAECKQTAERWKDFYQRFFKATFFENEHLEKGFITGEMNFEISRFFSNIPNFKHYNVIRNDFYDYFGLTESEVNLLFKECQITGQLAEKAKKWYGGYAVTNDVNTHLYNTQYLHQFLRKKVFNSSEPSKDKFKKLLRIESMKPILSCLVNRTSYAVELNDLSFNVDDYCTLVDLLGSAAKLTEAGKNAYLRLLVSQGFLTINTSEPTSAAGANVRVPNDQAVAALLELTREINTNTTIA